MTVKMIITEELCLRCGMCCDGTIFHAVELQPGDDANKLASLGLPVSLLRRRSHEANSIQPGPARPAARFPQPCHALGEDCRCRLYPNRPVHCRQFECALFKEVHAGAASMSDARRLIRVTRVRAARVRSLLRALGNTAEWAALSVRFRAVRRQVESGWPTGPGENSSETAGLFSRLSLAMHRLNVMLSENFYPDPPS